MHAAGVGFGDKRAASERVSPLVAWWPRQVDARGRLVLGVVRRDLVGLGEVEYDRPLPHAPNRERGGKKHALVILPAQRPEPLCDVHVGGPQNAELVERPQQASGPQHQPPVAVAVGHGVRPARRSDTATMTCPGGRHAHTPGVSSPVATPPHMPRRNR